jgi:hypothetical protein
MRGAIPPLPKYAFTAWRSVKAQGQLCSVGYTDVARMAGENMHLPYHSSGHLLENSLFFINGNDKISVKLSLCFN